MDADFRACAAKLSLGVALVYLAFLSPLVCSVDGGSMLAMSRSLLTHGSLTVPSSLGIVGRGGDYYSPWYPLLSIVALPFVAAGLFVAEILHLPANALTETSALLLSPMLTAATVYLTALLARRLGASARGALVAALGYASGTIALAYTSKFYAEPLLALLTVWAIFLQVGGTAREQRGAALLAGLAVLAKPSAVILGPLLSMHSAFSTRSFRAALRPLCGTAAGVALFCFYNVLRFGSPLSSGQPYDFALSNLAAGLGGLLVSPGRGLIWYCPVVIALFGLGKKNLKRPDTLLIIGVTGAYWGMYSLWGDWTGGWSWGPRFLLPALPGLLALTATLAGTWRKALPALIALGFVVNAPTMVSSYERVYWERMVAGVSPASPWSLSEAPIVRIWGAARREMRDARRTDVKDFVEEAEKPDAYKAEWLSVRIVPTWWWVLPAAGIPRAVGLAGAVALMLTGLWLVSAAIRPRPAVSPEPGFP